MLPLALGAVLAAGAGLLLALALPVRGRVPLLLAAGVLAAAIVVALALLATPFAALSRAWWLAGEGIVLVVAAMTWRRAGRPRPAWRRPPPLRRLHEIATTHPVVSAVVVLAAAAAALQLVVGVTTAPSNWDSMTYHLSRAAYWLQQGSIAHYDGASIRQLASPPNAEILFAWTMSLAGDDSFVTVIQWLALLGAALGIWVIARELALARHQAAFAAAVWMILPGPITQAATTQNDLVVTCFAIATVAFGLRALRGGGRGDVVIAGLAFGLGLGAKGSFVILLPTLALVLAAAVWQLRPRARIVATLVAVAAVGGVALGIYNYAANVEQTGSPLAGLKRLQERTSPVVGNVIRVSWSFADSPGVTIPWADAALTRTVGAAGRHWAGSDYPFVLDTTTREDDVTAGLVGFLVLFPLALFAVLRRRSPPLVRALGAGAVLYVVLFGVAHVATNFNGRLLMPAYALVVPLLGAVRPWTRGAIAVLAAASLLPVVLTNPAKTVLADRGQRDVWQLSRAEQMTANDPDQLGLVQALDARYGPGSRLVFIGGEDSWDYPLFGSHRQRWVARVDPGKIPRAPLVLCAVVQRLVRAHRADALVFSDAPRDVPAPTPEMRPIQVGPTTFIVTATKARGCDRPQPPRAARR